MKQCYITIVACVCLTALSVCVGRAADTKQQANKEVLELILGSQHQSHYTRTCSRQLEQYKRDYPSVPKVFWNQYSIEMEDEWVKDSILLISPRFTEEQFRELTAFATSSIGRKLAQEQVMIMKNFQSESWQLSKQRKTKMEAALLKKGYKKAVSLHNCIHNLRLLDSAKAQYAITKNLRKGDIITTDQISPYMKGGFTARICPGEGKYTINAVGQKPVCSIKEHRID